MFGVAVPVTHFTAVKKIASWKYSSKIKKIKNSSLQTLLLSPSLFVSAVEIQQNKNCSALAIKDSIVILV